MWPRVTTCHLVAIFPLIVKQRCVVYYQGTWLIRDVAIKLKHWIKKKIGWRSQNGRRNPLNLWRRRMASKSKPRYCFLFYLFYKLWKVCRKCARLSWICIQILSFDANWLFLLCKKASLETATDPQGFCVNGRTQFRRRRDCQLKPGGVVLV